MMEILNRWVEHFDNLLNIGVVHHYNNNTLNMQQVLILSPPSVEEVKIAIKKLKDNKAPGLGCLFSELLKWDSPGLFKGIHELVVNTWNSERMPGWLEHKCYLSYS